ncbi:MAG: hypothetical protein J6T88_08270 [Bacteroidales bacterium]|nr:hypothetical protein [Bacteroidales bacterium]
MSNQDFKQCNEILTSSFNLYFTFDKSELNKAKKNIIKNFNTWLTTATKNRNGLKYEWNVKFPERSLSTNTHHFFTQDQLLSIYMMDDEGVEEWANTGCVLVSKEGEELNILKKLQINNKFVPTKKYRIRKMTDWSTFGDNSSPCTDVIIVDRYLFAQHDVEYEINAYSLLKQLCKWAKGTTINIIFFTLLEYMDGKVPCRIQYNTIIKQIKNKLASLIGVEPNVTFVFMPDKEQHDRTIITNYKMYTSGDSFKYFEDGVNVALCTHGEWMDVNSLYDLDNLQNVKDFLSDLQIMIDNRKGLLQAICGDKKSLLLKF